MLTGAGPWSDTRDDLRDLWNEGKMRGFFFGLAIFAISVGALVLFSPIAIWKVSKERWRARIRGRFDILYCRLDWFAKYQRIGGSLSHSRGLIDAFKRRGTVLTVASEPLSGIQYKLHYLRKPRILAFLWNVLASFAVVWYAIKHRPRIIYQRYSWNGFAGVVAAKISRATYILEYNGSDVWINREWGPNHWDAPIRFFENFMLKQADKVICVSKELAKGIDKSIVCPNGVDLSIFNENVPPYSRYQLGFKDTDFVVGWVGTFGPWHGTDILQEAIFQDNHFKWLIIGHGKLVDEFLSKVGHKVKYVPEVPHYMIPRYLKTCNALVNISVNNEDGSPFFGSPTKLFEYLSVGVPVLTTKVGQMGEILTDGEDCRFVLPSWIDLLATLYELEANPERAESIGRRGAWLVRSGYTWDHAVRRILESEDR